MTVNTVTTSQSQRLRAIPVRIIGSASGDRPVSRPPVVYDVEECPRGYALLIASTTAPAGPEDVIGRAMARVRCHIEKFLAPVEPGNLLLLGYKDDVPVVSAPGCFRSARNNVVDLVLPPMLSRYRLSGWELASLGHGGLLG